VLEELLNLFDIHYGAVARVIACQKSELDKDASLTDDGEFWYATCLAQCLRRERAIGQPVMMENRRSVGR
jgi:hypothetical protein